jgi:hypothetical protein
VVRLGQAVFDTVPAAGAGRGQAAASLHPLDWHQALFERARERGLVCFSSPFDETAIELLEELGALPSRSPRSRRSTCR